MADYLEEAAALLRKVSADADKRLAGYPLELSQRRTELAEAFARLAAIERGVIPADLLAEVLRAAGAEDE